MKKYTQSCTQQSTVGSQQRTKSCRGRSEKKTYLILSLYLILINRKSHERQMLHNYFVSSPFNLTRLDRSLSHSVFCARIEPPPIECSAHEAHEPLRQVHKSHRFEWNNRNTGADAATATAHIRESASLWKYTHLTCYFSRNQCASIGRSVDRIRNGAMFVQHISFKKVKDTSDLFSF